LPSNSEWFNRWIWVRSPLFFFSVSAFCVLSALVTLGATSAFDEGITYNVKRSHANSTLNTIMVIFSFFGDISSLLFLAIALTIIRRTRRVGIIFLTSILIIVVLAMYIKVIVGQEMPPFVPPAFLNGTQSQVIEQETVSPSAKNLSYPATHVAIASCFAYLARAKLALGSQILASAIWFYPFFMAMSRLYILQYYFTDIAGGFLLGLIIAVSMSNIICLNKPK
jgi:undecaprenyl-diphosphatase